MKTQSHKCRSAYDRPDYDRLNKASYGTRTTRIAIAKQLILDGHSDCRAFDNCLEMGDGDEVVASIIAYAIQNGEFRAALARLFDPQCMLDGLPDRWLATYERVRNPLFAAVA